MGWTYYRAGHWKNGRIDRKAECEDCISDDYKILKSTMVGSTYYAAIEYYEGKKQIVFALVILTTTDKYDFGYKFMDETVGPGYYDCPISILNLLTPTDNEYANNWRKQCRENAKIKRLKRILSKADVNTSIRIKYPNEYSPQYKKDEEVILTKSLYRGKKYWIDWSKCIKWVFAHIPDNYEVLEPILEN